MKIIVKKVGCPAEVRELKELTLDDMQEMVGGFISPLYVGGDIDMWLNDEGKIYGLPLNFVLEYEGDIVDTIRGDVFFAGRHLDETIGLTDAQIKWIMNNINYGDLVIGESSDGKIGVYSVWHYNPTAVA